MLTDREAPPGANSPRWWAHQRPRTEGAEEENPKRPDEPNTPTGIGVRGRAPGWGSGGLGPPEQHRCSPTGKRHQARTAPAGGPDRGHAPKERRRRTRSDPTNPTRPQESGSGGEPPAGGLGGWAPQNNTDAHRPGSATRREQLPL